MGYESNTGLGVVNHYGPRDTDASKGGQAKSVGKVKRAEWSFDYSDLPTYGSTNLEFSIPANATIVSSTWVTGTAWAGGTSLNVGLYTSAGVAIDADGLITVSEATQTAIAVANSRIVGAGALVNKGIGANAGELKVTPNVDDLTAGAGRVVVKYVYNK